MQEYQFIRELGLPIVTPARDLAIPTPILDNLYSQTIFPPFWGPEYCWNQFYCGNQYQAGEPQAFEYMPMIEVTNLEGMKSLEKHDASLNTLPYNYENSLTHASWNAGKSKRISSFTYCLPKETYFDQMHRTSEINPNKLKFRKRLDSDTYTNAFTPEMRKRKKSLSKFYTKEEGMPLLEKLKGHPCRTEHVYNPTTKRMNKTITWLYPSWGKTFTKTWNILDHFKVHTGEKPYSCRHCKKSFSQKGNLTKHLKLSKSLNCIPRDSKCWKSRRQ